MKNNISFHAIMVLVLGLASLNTNTAHAALIDRGGGLIYDTSLNITWLADANYAMTSGYDSDGRMTWSEAIAWAANLSYSDSVRNVTYDDWRLPNTNPVNGTTFNNDGSFNGSTDYGFNVSEQGTAYAGSTGSEMSYLFYNSLDNKGYCDPVASTASSCTPQAGWGLSNTGPFSNIQLANYWSGTEYSLSNIYAWNYYFADGSQNPNVKYLAYFAWAVRPGDVAAVPIPSAFWLFGSGVIGMLGFMRRRNTPQRNEN